MSHFQDGEVLVKQNPHPIFDKFAIAGYTLRFCWGKEKSAKSLSVEALFRNCVIAEADFSDDDDAIHCQNIRVENNHRRRGIANTIYVFAEIAYNKWLNNFWKDGSNDQSGDGRALWEQPSRPFGHPGKIAGQLKA